MLKTYAAIGSLIYFILKKDREKTIRNINFVYGEDKSPDEIESIAHDVFRHQAKNLADYLYTLDVTTCEDFLQLVEINGEDHLKNAYDRGQGVICLVSHTGSWEFSAITPSLLGYETTAVSKALKDEKLNDKIIHYRQKRGMKNLSRGKTYPLLIDALNRGECLIIMIDQDTRVKSVFADFLGKQAYTPIGAAKLALDTQAAVVPMSMHRLPNDKHRFTIKPEINVRHTGNMEEDLQYNTEQFNQVIGEFINMDPSQWVWMHERWKTTPQRVEELIEAGVIKK